MNLCQYCAEVEATHVIMCGQDGHCYAASERKQHSSIMAPLEYYACEPCAAARANVLNTAVRPRASTEGEESW